MTMYKRHRLYAEGIITLCMATTAAEFAAFCWLKSVGFAVPTDNEILLLDFPVGEGFSAVDLVSLLRKAGCDAYAHRHCNKIKVVGKRRNIHEKYKAYGTYRGTP